MNLEGLDYNESLITGGHEFPVRTSNLGQSMEANRQGTLYHKGKEPQTSS